MTLPLFNVSSFKPSSPGATAATRYVGATPSGAPVSGTFQKGDFIIDQTGQIWICTTAGTPGTWQEGGTGLGGAPSGPAGGSLAGSYPNPTVAVGALTSANMQAAYIDGAAGVASMRTLGTSASQATAGNASVGGVLTGNLPNPGLATNSVGSAQIAPGAVATANIAAKAVTKTQLGNAAVALAQMVSGAGGINIVPHTGNCVAAVSGSVNMAAVTYTPNGGHVYVLFNQTMFNPGGPQAIAGQLFMDGTYTGFQTVKFENTTNQHTGLPTNVASLGALTTASHSFTLVNVNGSTDTNDGWMITFIEIP